MAELAQVPRRFLETSSTSEGLVITVAFTITISEIWVAKLIITLLVLVIACHYRHLLWWKRKPSFAMYRSSTGKIHVNRRCAGLHSTPAEFCGNCAKIKQVREFFLSDEASTFD